MQEADPNIVVVGGGTGSFTLLNEFKELTPNISAIVNMSDDGGSTGKLRDELGVLPPGDIRQCLVALSRLDEVRDMFSHRFSGGDLKGHALGNLVLSGLEELHEGDFQKALEVAGRMLRITGDVIPVTYTKHQLKLTDNGVVILGEKNISHGPIPRGAVISHSPAVTISDQAEEAIHKADAVVIAPGNFYGSILPVLATRGMRETLRDTGAHVSMVCNLVNKPGQTEGWHVTDYERSTRGYVDRVDTVIFNTRLPDQSLLDRYAEDGEKPVRACPAEFEKANTDTRFIGDDLLSDYIQDPNNNDVLIRRTYIRHSAKKVGQHILSLARRRTSSTATA